VRRAVLPLVLLLAAIALAGCSSSRPYDHATTQPLPSTVVGSVPKTTTQSTAVPAVYKNGDPTAGEQVFKTAGCSGCHTLKAAGATGTVGPNLDQLKPPLSRVVPQVINGGATMPPFKGQLSDKQIADVAAFVVKSTGGNLNG
jgi:mono/diheme cytochrome c family protein